MRFGLIANLKRTGAVDAIRAFIKWSKESNQKLVLCKEIHNAVPEFDHFVERNRLAHESDMIVSMGGDGTLLATSRAIGDSGTPILGINLGSLGFLTQQTPDELIKALNDIVAGRYTIEERMLLQTDVNGDGKFEAPTALNDVVIDNGSVSRVLHIKLEVNGEEVVTYMADGLVIATPTGSTAYSLAIGGPIMKPGMEAMIGAAIAPFSLTTRPMIFHGDDVIDITVMTEGRLANLTIDGQVNFDLSDGQRVRVSKAGFKSRFVQFPENSFYKLLRSKLNWGLPPKY